MVWMKVKRIEPKLERYVSQDDDPSLVYSTSQQTHHLSKPTIVGSCSPNLATGTHVYLWINGPPQQQQLHKLATAKTNIYDLRYSAPKCFNHVKVHK